MGWPKLDDEIASLATGEQAMTEGSGWSINPTTGQISSNGFGLDMAGADITNVKAIMSASGNWRIGEDGKLVVKEIETENLNVKNKAKFGIQENPQGITIFDKITKEPLCVSSENKMLILKEGECNE